MDIYAPEEFNNAELVGFFEPGTSDWHEARADGLGGSEIGTVMGLNPYESPYALWAKKTGQIQVQELNSWPIRFGKAYESAILDLFKEEHPDIELFRTGTYRSKEFPFLQANPDALAKDKDGNWVVVEVKTARTSWSEIPPSYIAQLRHYMFVLGIDKGVIVAEAGKTWVEEWIDRDDFLEQTQIWAAKRFWECVTLIKRPDWDGSESTYQAVREMHPLITDEEVEIDGGHELVLANKDFKEAEARLLKAKSIVADLMGNAKSAYIFHEGKKHYIATRQAKRDGNPYLVIKG